MEKVGTFLSDICGIYDHKKPEEQDYIKLYYAHSTSEIIDIISDVYGTNEGKLSLRPHSILICGSDTTENILEVMFERIKCDSFTGTYVIIGVNNLGFKLQEVSQFYSECDPF